jgi:hypothetical protein
MMTQNDQILKYLEAGNTITPIDALQLFGCFRLSARIFELRQKGYKIGKVILRRSDTNYACYFMETDKLSLAKRVGL